MDASGLGARAFAAREQLSLSSLWGWKRRLQAKEGPKMVPVVVRQEAFEPRRHRGATLDVLVGDRIVIRVPPDFEEGALSRLLSVLDR